ncbi:hypothetical protein [Altericista sp. CCNU0014]|uniref:hypothetical protein n=1 Tax=Altericista sp. CCNU0014 TaxID=3082949 RepID=UPI00384B85E8
MMRSILELVSASLVGVVMLTGTSAFAQTVTTPITSTSTSNPVSNLDQSGALINTQINTNQLGRSVVGNGIADCTTSGISASGFGSGVGPFDSGTLGGAITYTHSFGMKTCKEYAKTQLGKLRLETCLLLISNYSKMQQAGIRINYNELMAISNINCPAVELAKSKPISSNPTDRPESHTSDRSQKKIGYDAVDIDSTPKTTLTPRPATYDSRRDSVLNPNNYPNRLPITELRRTK